MTNLRQEFGDLTLRKPGCREENSHQSQGCLGNFGWNGATVSKVEIRLIDPPENKKAMHKQKTAEQERRSMRLLHG